MAASLSKNQLIACSGYLFWGSLPAESAGERATPPPSRASRFCLSLNVDVLAEKLGSGGWWGGGLREKWWCRELSKAWRIFWDFGEKNPRRVNWFVWVLDIIIYIHISLQKFSYHLGTCDPPVSCCKPLESVDSLIPGAKQCAKVERWTCLEKSCWWFYSITWCFHSLKLTSFVRTWIDPSNTKMFSMFSIEQEAILHLVSVMLLSGGDGRSYQGGRRGVSTQKKVYV